MQIALISFKNEKKLAKSPREEAYSARNKSSFKMHKYRGAWWLSW